MTAVRGARATVGAPSSRPERSPAVGSLYRAVRSPYAAFCLWVVLGAALLQLRWSTLFVSPRPEFWLLLVFALVVFVTLALASRWMPPTSDRERVRIANVAGITVYFVAAYAASGGIPLVLILRGAPYDIYSFGLPGLHVAALSFTGYYGVRLFRALMLERTIGHLGMFGWVTALLLSMASRSAVSFLAFSCLIVFVRARRMRFSGLVVAAGAVGVFLLAFGQFGNARLSFQVEQATGQQGSSSAIVNYARASSEFAGTGVPTVWLWPYLYLASPLANLNAAFEYADGGVCGQECDLAGLVFYELVPDTVGVPVAQALDVDAFDKNAFLVSPQLTASTTFGSAVGTAGLVGAVAVLAVLVLVGVGVTRAVRGSPLQEEAMAILATLYFFSFFSNMLVYTAFSAQLIWVTIAAARSRRARDARARAAARAERLEAVTTSGPREGSPVR
ncbi:hypothetical protein Celf_0724 [Cellulomonas fimi ATCC 484]|uniref:O-antigen polymerase n=1 Tax=Cellulomonas fimi (strain ATCC 484 / DSM 20113 / JCM 1341 / CCUG 24087 / LMG 16345 / NBRC 15513 / NCIMB 8980 / NCTC 7547 / NRS-133) TaxID=590998 RepID=F4GZE3_CELFA|nr:hypothetical protein Celf_0724 [Cellulomonas fimi ATCC 484]VEH27520.1 Uncharacterised protein [Cellulomonas fimi]